MTRSTTLDTGSASSTFYIYQRDNMVTLIYNFRSSSPEDMIDKRLPPLDEPQDHHKHRDPRRRHRLTDQPHTSGDFYQNLGQYLECAGSPYIPIDERAGFFTDILLPQVRNCSAPASSASSSPELESDDSMSDHRYYHSGSHHGQEDDDQGQYFTPYDLEYSTYAMPARPDMPAYTYAQPMAPQRYHIDPQQLLQPQYQYSAPMMATPSSTWPTMPYAPQQPIATSAYGYSGFLPTTTSSFPPLMEETALEYPLTNTTEESAAHLALPVVAESSRTRANRATSSASRASSASYQTDNSRSTSPNALEMARWGYRLSDGRWKCSYPDCQSLSTFQRGCDLRKHYKRHTKTLFCRYKNCAQSVSGGFSSKKDRLRHEASHNPDLPCEWPGCERKFSRVDNMKDHVRRVHLKHATGSRTYTDRDALY